MSEHDERERFSLYRLCECPKCDGSGKEAVWAKRERGKFSLRTCPECRGEGRIRQEVASAGSPEAVGVALVTLAREGEFEGCQFGLLDRGAACERCYGAGLVAFGGGTIRCPECSREHQEGMGGHTGKKTGTWLVLPWPATARTLSAAGRLLRSSQTPPEPERPLPRDGETHGGPTFR